MKLSIFLGCVCVLVLSGCTESSRESEVQHMTKNTVQTPTASGSNIGFQNELERVPKNIRGTNEFDNCMKPQVNMCTNQVASQLARTGKDEKFCDELTDAQGKDGCRFGVVVMKATESKNPDDCNTLSSVNRGQCRSSIITMVATEKKDIQMCDNLTEKTQESSSGTMINDPILNTLGDQCKLSVIQAKEGAKTEDCKALSNKMMREMCETMIKTKNTPPPIPEGMPTTPVAPAPTAPVSAPAPVLAPPTNLPTPTTPMIQSGNTDIRPTK